jgi:hypothetical protein
MTIYRSLTQFCLLALCVSGGDVGAQSQSRWRSAAEIAYSRASDRMKAAPKEVEVLCAFARATFYLADYSTNASERAELARVGIEAARSAIKLKPGAASGHYYLGMNLGQLARTRFLSALKIVGEMEAAFIKACDLDASFDHAGPYRNLGLLYREAPVLGSVGSRRKAQHNLHKAAETAPLYLDNRLNLIEACLKWSDRNGVVREFKRLQEDWDAAKKRFSGTEWERDWADWEARRNQAAEKLKQPAKGIKSPREQ